MKRPIRDFSDMSVDALRAFANALDQIARKAQEKEMRKRRTLAHPSQQDKTQ